MSDRARLMRAILENPGDMHLRLVFADWVEERGDSEWAAFIRYGAEKFCGESFTLSYGNAARTAANLSMTYQPTAIASRTLVKRAAEWMVGIDLDINAFGWQGGLLASIHLKLDEFMEHAAVIFGNHPVTWVSFEGLDAVQDQDAWVWNFRKRWQHETESDLPFDLWPEDIQAKYRDVGLESFSLRCSSEETANQFASILAVGYGRKLAGLTPLPAPSPPYQPSPPPPLPLASS